MFAFEGLQGLLCLLVSAGLFFGMLYVVIRVGVRDGMRDASRPRYITPPPGYKVPE